MQRTSKTKPGSPLFRLKTAPFLQAALHKTRRVLGKRELQRINGASPAETAVLEAIRAALQSEPAGARIRGIEEVRKRYLASNVRLTDDDRGRTSTLAGAASVSRSPRPAWLLHLMIKELSDSMPPSQEWVALELGTCVGISGSYQALALPPGAKLLTFELFPDLAEQSRKTFDSVRLADKAQVVVGNIDDTLTGVLANVPHVDYAFVDGNHHREPTLAYTKRILEKSHEGTVLVFDDIDWSVGMRDAWRTLCDDPHFSLLISLGSMGIAVVGSAPRRVVRVHFG